MIQIRGGLSSHDPIDLASLIRSYFHEILLKTEK